MYSNDPFSNVPAGLGPALKARGFDKLTAIQSAVLGEDVEGRDIRVSSQTGSGKTVAIGLAIAEDLVKDGEDRSSHGKAQPQCVLIAPTRELAAQLGEELSWLYRPLNKNIVVVTGGTNIGLDFRNLKRNPEVLIGTPGRLFDHVQRGSFDLSQVQAVVLDEADEMLDMGFRDELEGILQVTPDERRTHMVSATFPREVLALASRYQNNAITVEGGDPKKANTDITHIAHDLRMGDRVDALINILLAEPDERTLVFVRTRISTTEVAANLTAAGFRAFPLNGEMGQRERTSTLDAFRSGKVQLLIATDVAARGLDIQNVTRIIHYDLPENPEAFTHRSGRTGRAGAKGTSVLFVPPGGRRKAEYLARSAKIRAESMPVPSVREIREGADARLIESFDPETLASKTDERLLKLADQLLEGREAKEVVAELLSRMNITGPCEPRHIQAPHSSKSHDRFDSRGPSNKGDFGRSNKGGRPPTNSEDYTSFQVTWGARQGADPRRVLALVCRRGNVRSGSIGAIRITDHGSVVEVRKTDASTFEKSASRPDARDPRIKIRPWLPTSERGKTFGQKAGAARKKHPGEPARGFPAKARSKAKGGFHPKSSGSSSRR